MMTQNPPWWERLADALGETDPGPRSLIRRVGKALGRAQMEALAEAAHACYAGEGMLVPDGSRKRTLGGVFFAMAREACTPEQRAHFFPTYKERDARRKAWKAREAAAAALDAMLEGDASAPAVPAAPPIPTLPPFVWADRRRILAEAQAAPGAVKSMKVTLIGRPGRVILRQDVAMTLMTYTAPQTGFPKGVPAPPSAPQPCSVYIGAKQWAKVAEAIEDPEDVLIVEGVLAYDPELEGLSVHATNVTTKLLQQQKKATSSAAS